MEDNLFFVAVMIVDADERAAESENLSKSDKHRVVYLSHRLCDEPACEQCAPESAHCYRYYELDFSHFAGHFYAFFHSKFQRNR